MNSPAGTQNTAQGRVPSERECVGALVRFNALVVPGRDSGTPWVPCHPLRNMSPLFRVVASRNTLMKQLKVPAGFTVKPFAKDLGNVRMMAQGTDGTIYVTRRA